MGRLSGKIAIVTGASRGIGRGTAIAFAEAGAKVVVAARTVAKVEEVCALIKAAGGEAVAVACDVQKASDIEACVAKTVEAFGGVDIVINNAQNIEYLYLMDSSDQTMANAMDSGPFATFRFMRAAYPHLKARGGGVIVNVGSDAMHLAITARYGPYNAAKAAIEALTRTASDEWGAEGIHSFMINPSAESVMTENWRNREPDKYAAAVKKMPGSRLGDPLEDIGRPLIGLVLDAERLSGKTLKINAGGITEVVETISEGAYA
jgi:NAD(P)-dependent dehydrogenase (short-subunit alcohol dehydrogenase family)